MRKLYEEPLISVVIPVFNAEQYLDLILGCIDRQTYENYEILFIDDHSSDDSIKILMEASKRNSRIKLIIRDRLPKGAPTCRNIGLSKAKGKYIIYIDSDDIFTDTFLEKRVEFMETNADCDYATFRGSTVKISNGHIEYIEKTWGEPVTDDMLDDFLSTNYPFSIWNNIYRLDIFRNELWDEKLRIYQDFDFAVMTILKNYRHKFALNEEFDYYYRIGLKNNLSSSFTSDSKLESTKYLFDKIWNYVIELPNSTKYKKAFTKYFILQYSRLLYEGTEKQIVDYINFCKKYLNINKIRKMRIIFKIYIFFIKLSVNRQVLTKVIMGMFYRPKKTLFLIGRKMIKRVSLIKIKMKDNI